MVILESPLNEEMVRSLGAGEVVHFNGYIYTARDKVHKLLFETAQNPPFDLTGQVIYHCGPVMDINEGEGNISNRFKVLSCGPTTSTRLDMYEWKLIEEYGVRAILGKGGMGERTRKALKDYGAVYLHAISGAAVYLADMVVGVDDVWMYEEFGVTDAMWKLKVREFPAIVTMDSSGQSIHEEVLKDSLDRAKRLTE